MPTIKLPVTDAAGNFDLGIALGFALTTIIVIAGAKHVPFVKKFV